VSSRTIAEKAFTDGTYRPDSEVQDKLPDYMNKSMVRKRVDTARKIYDIFSVIGENKIRRIKFFTASSFQIEVAYIIKNFKD